MDAGAQATWQRFPLFRRLDQAPLAAIAGGAKIRNWTAGAAVYLRGEPSDFMVALTAGRVRLSSLTSSGRELLLSYAEPGDLFGEISCLEGGERSSDAIAVAKATGLAVSRKLFHQVAERYPHTHAAAVEHLCSVIRETNDRLETMAFCHLQARLARFLLSSLQKAHGPKLGPNPHISLGLSQTDLGRILPASRPKVNRLFQEFRRRGVLVQVGNSWQCDVAALRQIAQQET